MSARRIALLSVLLGLSAALAMPAPATAQEGRMAQGVDVVVENRGSSPVGVYALSGGHMVLLDVVDAADTETVAIPPAVLESSGAIQLVADRVGSTDWYKSDAMVFRPDDAITFTVEPDIDRSRVAVSE